MELSELLKFKNVTKITTIEELNSLINLDLIRDSFEELEFNLPKNSIFLFDSVDLNSAFLHEWAANKLSSLTDEKLDKFDVYYIQSTDEFRELIGKFHKNIGYDWDIKDSKAQKMNPNTKFEIFEIVYLKSNDEYFWKTDDYDIINEYITQTAIDVCLLN